MVEKGPLIYNTNLYAKIFAEKIELLGETTPDRLFHFLTKNQYMAFDNFGSLLKGDFTIWYFGCCEKQGVMSISIYDNFRKLLASFSEGWDRYKSSFEIVKRFVNFCHENEIFNDDQIVKLMKIIEEGEKIDNIYQISDYLAAKREKRKWIKKPRSWTR